MKSRLNEKVVTGWSEKGSKSEQARSAIHQQALDAAEKADLDQMFTAYERVVEERSESEQAMMGVLSMTIGKDGKLPDQSLGSIRAMKEVCLAAISLARDVALNAQPRK